MYIRIGGLMPTEGYDVPFRIGEAVTLRDGCDVTIIATGPCVATTLLKSSHRMLPKCAASAAWACALPLRRPALYTTIRDGGKASRPGS